MSVDTKKAREVADRRWMGGLNEEIKEAIRDLSDEVDLLRKQNWQARQKIGTLEQEVDRLQKESEDYWRSACHWKKKFEEEVRDKR